MKYLTSIWTVIAVIAFGLFLKISNVPQIEQIQLMGFDAKIKSLPKQKDEDVILYEIGEGTLEKWGQFPLPRQYYAQMISDLINANAEKWLVARQSES